MIEGWHSFLDWLTLGFGAPWWAFAVICGASALLFWSQSHWVTIVHELGHAITGSILGMKVESISLNSDSSGLTKSFYVEHRGLARFVTAPFRWVRRVLVAGAGYPAPFAFALLASASAYFSMPRAFLGACLLGAVYVFLKAEGWTSRWIAGVSVVALGFALVLESPVGVGCVVSALYGAGIGGGAQGLLSISRVTTLGEREHSDAADLASITLIPARVWVWVFYLASAVMALGSVWVWARVFFFG